MSTSPLDPPDATGLDRQAARTLAEHLPQGYTADLAREQQPQQAQGGRNESIAHADQGGRAASPAGPSVHVQRDPNSLGQGSDSSDVNAQGEPPADEISSLQLQGGDVHRSLFKMAEASARMPQLQRPRLMTPSPLSLANAAEPAIHPPPPPLSPPLLPSPYLSPPQRPIHRRSATYNNGYTHTNDDDTDDDRPASRRGSIHQADEGVDGLQPMPVRELMAPQGFRRDFVQQQVRQRQLAEREATMQRRRSHLRERRNIASYGAVRIPIARNFVEFLELYGHFADEDLEASDDDDDDDDNSRSRDLLGDGSAGAGGDEEEDDDEDPERQPLLNRSASGAVGSGAGDGGKAKADLSQAFFTLLKAFVGTGIMFLPKAYNNGGMVFSTVTLLVVSLMSMAGFQLLLACRQRCGGGYGDIGLAIAGARMRSLILGSITLSQLGFVCAGIVFAAENLASFAAAVAHSHTRLGGGGDGVDDSVISTNMLIAIEVAVLVPLGFVRDIARLGPAALLGDVFIAIGLVYMYTYDICAIASRGWHVHETVDVWINPSGYALTIGAAIFTFEGIGLILPIQSSMARPERFGFLLCVVMLIITVAYISVGALGYAAFGAYTKTEVIDNYPRGSSLVQAVQFLYAIAVLAGMPVQLFPAVRIIEGKLFGTSGGAATYRSGKRNPRVKWAKNGMRAGLVLACGAVAVLGAGHLDQFVALIGSVACVPLLFIYPPLLHYMSAGPEVSVVLRAFDIGLVGVGTAAMVFTTVVTLKAGL